MKDSEFIWTATWRVDTEPVFTTDSCHYRLETSDLVEAAKYIQKQLGSSNTLISLERDV